MLMCGDLDADAEGKAEGVFLACIESEGLDAEGTAEGVFLAGIESEGLDADAEDLV